MNLVSGTPLNTKLPREPVPQTQPKQVNGFASERENLRDSLDRGWAVAAADFKLRTGLQLGDFNGGKDGVLGSLRSAYDENNEKMKKHDALWQVIDKVLTGVEWVGSLASSIGGLIFPPAGACFSAIEALINIPRLIKKLSDDLRKLFDRIMSFFTNLKVLRRADAQLGLDDELVRKTNEILMCLVRVCAIAIHARDHKWSTISSSLFLGDDKMDEALKEFKILCEDQNKLITTVTLEEAMQTRSITKDINGRTIVIESQTREANEGIKDLRADNALKKNREATQDMVSQIKKEWKIHETEINGSHHELGPRLANLLPGTYEALAANEQYSAWADKKHHRRLLYLSGDIGTGRTFFLAALARRIEEEKRNLVEGDPSIYLVYYSFKGVDETNSDENKGRHTALHTALKDIACCLAQQSTTYAKLLFEEYRSLRDENLESLWTQLKFESFDAPAKSVLYLLFDGLDQLKNSRPLVDVLESIVANDKARISGDKLKLRIILTGAGDTISKKFSIPTIDVTEINKPLIRHYVQSGMQDLLGVQDTDTLSSGDLLVEDILMFAEGSFSAASQRLKTVDDAIIEDLDFDEICQRVKSQTISTLEQEGAQLLADTCEALKPYHREQLKEILYWSAFGVFWPRLDILQASLFLQRQTRSLESLERKIQRRFAKVLSVQGDVVVIDSRVRQYIVSVNVDSASPPGNSSTPDDANASSSKIKDNLYEGNPLQVSTIEGHYTIVKRCLQVLNEDDPAVRDKTRSLIKYASWYLPEHISALKNANFHKLNTEQRKLIGEGMIEFLSDEECVDTVWTEGFLHSATWIGDAFDSPSVLSIGELLADKGILQEMSPKNRRIARKFTQQLTHRPAPFLELLAIRAAWHWLHNESEPVGGENDNDEYFYKSWFCYRFVDEYLNLVGKPESKDEKAVMQGGVTGMRKLIRVDDINSSSLSDENPDSDPERKTKQQLLPVSNEAVYGPDKELERIDTDAGSKKAASVLLQPLLSSKERVERDKSWAFEKLGLQENSLVFTRMGQALQNQDNAAAIEYLLKASTLETGSSFHNRYTRGRTLATTYESQNDLTSAYTVLVPIIDELRVRRKEMSLTDTDKKRFAAVMKQAAGCLTKLQKDNEAMILLEECLEQMPDKSVCREELLRLLCKNNQFVKAEIAFDNWVTSSGGDAAQSPATYFTKTALSNPTSQTELFFWVHRTSIHDRIIGILEAAITDAKRKENFRDVSSLLLTQGYAHAVVGQEESLQLAYKSWTESVLYAKNAERFSCWESNELASQYEFDFAIKKLGAQPGASLEVRQAAFERLKSAIQSYFIPVQDFYGSVVSSPMVYVAVFARLAGLMNEAKTILRPDVEKALDVLSNSDAEDDELGIAPLHRIMLSLGDIVGASSFWSFFDRKSLAAKKTKATSKVVDKESVAEDTINQEIRASPGSADTTTTIGATNDGESHKEPYDTDFQFTAYCNSCGNPDLDSRLDVEIWCCTYCPNMDLCQKCHEKIKSKQNEQVVCSAEHVHVLMKHYDYDEAEVRSQNVRIDWQLIQSDGGRDRQRIGGRIVKLSDWVQILRKEWDIPETKTEGRLQK